MITYSQFQAPVYMSTAMCHTCREKSTASLLISLNWRRIFVYSVNISCFKSNVIGMNYIGTYVARLKFCKIMIDQAISECHTIEVQKFVVSPMWVGTHAWSRVTHGIFSSFVRDCEGQQKFSCDRAWIGTNLMWPGCERDKIYRPSPV